MMKYIYQATLERVVDGDTVDIVVDGKGGKRDKYGRYLGTIAATYRALSEWVTDEVQATTLNGQLIVSGHAKARVW
jgi:endonuclease YncB( thermonuclease family)